MRLPRRFILRTCASLEVRVKQNIPPLVALLTSTPVTAAVVLSGGATLSGDLGPFASLGGLLLPSASFWVNLRSSGTEGLAQGHKTRAREPRTGRGRGPDHSVGRSAAQRPAHWARAPIQRSTRGDDRTGSATAHRPPPSPPPLFLGPRLTPPSRPCRTASRCSGSSRRANQHPPRPSCWLASPS